MIWLEKLLRSTFGSVLRYRHDERCFAVSSRVGQALEVDRVMREQAPAGWKGDHAREARVLNALFPLLGRNRAATRALFELVKNQPGYG